MERREKVLVAWSGGKDSALSVHEINSSGRYEIESLLCTLTKPFDRVSMHGVRRPLIERQASAIGCSLTEVFTPYPCSNESYESLMTEALLPLRDSGIQKVVYGDIFLEDIRTYREGQMKKIGMSCLFPLWGKDSPALVRSFVDEGFRAVITCVDSTRLDRTCVGRILDHAFLDELPEGVDPSGENGEFHTFVFDGPLFRQPVSFEAGDIRLRDERFYFCDLIPA
ncbi:MAG TPA: diphthine--ammonia ligase [Syntrophales bacterium]|nr:diphthine--ammonia ligase [Syntrophales bacterium]HOX93606.1 diphthine--ammonia ligase [Syntrophales bacterium]HPI56902.1 diphthine--ammonia ligase [Syntrophales bacterium]HPN23488.1 diphthine--ammonia ligase [Syntrophales bacterium]HQM27987.1 diphthine--ammonia ligase [Syntrophales bacterium]